MFSDDGAILNERALDPALLLMSLGVCGPYPLQRLAAFACELRPTTSTKNVYTSLIFLPFSKLKTSVRC